MKWRHFVCFDPIEIARWLDDSRHAQHPENGRKA
jgi:hypothetical protein